METAKTTLVIDIEKVLKSKGAKNVPKFIVNFLKRIVHQEELNKILRDNTPYTGVDFATHALEDLGVSFRVHNQERLPSPDKKCIFVSNHPLGGLDGLVQISFIGKMMGDVKFIVNDLLMFIKPLEPIFIPINKYGRMKEDYAHKINDAFSSDAQILNFPAGLCSRLIKGEIKDLPWKKTFVTKALEYERDIVPLYFSGRNSMFFYRIAKLRKFFKIKFNIETLFLVDELFKQKNTIFDIYIGETIPVESITKVHSATEWTDIIREKCYRLKP